MSKVATLRNPKKSPEKSWKSKKTKPTNEKMTIAPVLCNYCGEIVTVKNSADNKVINFAAEPCDKCKERMEKGIMICETVDGQVEESKPRRTGRLIVITEESFRQLFTFGEETKDRFFFMEESMFEKVFGELMTEEKTEILTEQKESPDV